MNNTKLKQEDIVKAISGILIVFAFIAVISLFANAFDGGVSASPGDSSGNDSSNEFPPTVEYITFYVDEVEYQAYKGATWNDFVKTNADLGFKQMESAGVVYAAKQDNIDKQNDNLIIQNGDIVQTSAVIKPDNKYVLAPAYRIRDGVYVLNKTVSTVSMGIFIPFKTNSNSYTEILGNSESLAYLDGASMTMAFPYESGTWSDINFRFINVPEAAVVTKEQYDWFDANTKQCEIGPGKYKFSKTLDFSWCSTLYGEEEGVLQLLLPSQIHGSQQFSYLSNSNPFDAFTISYGEENTLRYLYTACDSSNPYKTVSVYLNGWNDESWRYIYVPSLLYLNATDKYGNIYDNTRDIFLLMEQAEYLGSS